MCVCCAGYITPVTERSPGGLTPAKARDNRAGREAPEPAVEDAEHRLVRAGYSGHDVPTRHGSPGPELTSTAANDARFEAGAGAPWIDEVVGRVAHALHST